MISHLPCYQVYIRRFPYSVLDLTPDYLTKHTPHMPATTSQSLWKRMGLLSRDDTRRRSFYHVHLAWSLVRILASHNFLRPSSFQNPRTVAAGSCTQYIIPRHPQENARWWWSKVASRSATNSSSTPAVVIDHLYPELHPSTNHWTKLSLAHRACSHINARDPPYCFASTPTCNSRLSDLQPTTIMPSNRTREGSVACSGFQGRQSEDFGTDRLGSATWSSKPSATAPKSWKLQKSHNMSQEKSMIRDDARNLVIVASFRRRPPYISSLTPFIYLR